MKKDAEPGPCAATPVAHGLWKDSYDATELCEVSCPDCGSTSFNDIATEFGLAIARCRKCGLVYTRTPLVTPQSHYLVSKTEYLAKYGAIFRGAAPHPRDHNYDEQLRLLERFGPPSDLLDVGSHCGFFLRRARKRGWRTTGVEPSAVSACLARDQFKLNVVVGTLEEVSFPSCSFDVVTLVDVLEHISRPRSLLEEVKRVLRPAGLVLIKTPNVRYTMAKHRFLRRIPGILDDSFDAREHLVHYSARTLARVLTSSGFTIEVMKVPSPIQTGDRLRRHLRAAGSAAVRYLPGGTRLPLAPDLLVVARSHG